MLGALNLSEFVSYDNDGKPYLDREGLSEAVRSAVVALNDVLDEGLDLHPLQEQRDTVRDWRQIGLGVMGVADMLIKLELPYDSEEGITLCKMVATLIANVALQKSSELAVERGRYAKYSEIVMQSDYFKTIASEKTTEMVRENGLRNSQLLTIAPTGTISTMLGISGGVEPIFANSYNRKTESLHGKDVVYKVYTPIVDKYMKEHGLTEEEQLPKWFVTSSTIDPMKRIDMQAAWQTGVDASISSTVNLPQSATVEDIEKLYMLAWERGLKGLTIFRAGCKRAPILDSSKKKPEEPEEKTLKRGEIISCSSNLVGIKRKLQSGCGSLHCLAYFDPNTGDMVEVYLAKGSTGGCVDADTEYFNGAEWKKISEYQRDSGEKVLQYNEDGTANLVEPVNYVVNDNVETLKRFTSDTGLDMALSGDHRMFLLKNYRKFKTGMRKELTTEIITVDDYLTREQTKTLKDGCHTERHVPTTFKYNGKGIPLSDAMIRLLVAIYADGRYDGHKIIVTVKKNHKKERLRELLKNCDIGHSERPIVNTDYITFYLYPTPSLYEWFADKQFTAKWYDCTDDQLRVVVDECVHWDGSLGEGNRLGAYFTSKKNEADFMQFALTRLGYRATIALNNPPSQNAAESYRIRWTDRNVHNLRFATIEDYKTTDGHSYCFTVPSGLLVLRRNNQIFVTGNCANFMTGLSRMISLALRGGISVYDIKDQLDSTGACPSYAVRSATKHDTSKGACCPMAVGNALVSMYKEMQERLHKGTAPVPKKELVASKKTVPVKQVAAPVAKMNASLDDMTYCPECGEKTVREGGCIMCKSCGWSKCN